MAETTINHGILISLYGTQDFTIAASFVCYDFLEEKKNKSRLFLTWLLSWHKQSLIKQKLLNGSWIQPWWCARNQAMPIYLVMTSLIFAGSSAYCFLLYARRYSAIMLSFRLFCRRLIANFTEDGLRGNVWHAWWTFLRGRLGNVNGMSQEEYFINCWKLCDCDLFICFVGIHI